MELPKQEKTSGSFMSDKSIDLPRKYEPKVSEDKWQKFWDEKQVYAFQKEDTVKEVFSIDTPPPTVSGKMHLGHAFSYAQQDFVARYKRMKGFNVFYPFGTDDNGLPTKLLVEKTKKVKASMMERKDFVKLCLDTLETEIRPKYIVDWKRIGVSCDFNLFYTTINDHCQKISQKSFIDLYKKGREYRTEAPAMYCPKCQTAISQVECEDKEIDSFFNNIVFKTKNNDGSESDLIIATTRPELLPACVAVFYHPSDERYQKYEGKQAKVPLFDFEVPILADQRADPEKGTGIVMCCTFGDSTDCEWQKAHHLPIKEAFGKNGKMTALANEYEGLKIEDARKEIITAMKEKGLLLEQKPIKHAVNVHERCGTPIEFIHSKQWFIKYLDLKEDMIQWGNELKWSPAHMKNRYNNWVNGLQWDWCISRQLPFGIPFPVWYCKDCDEVILASDESLPVDPLSDKAPVDRCPKCGCIEFVPEKDILNTWATSSLSPQIAASLVPERYDDIYPMSLRPQAHDIISFWLFNTVVKSRLHNNVNPWKETIISGWALDPKGKKMSKSKGNVIEPQAMTEKYSADALRFWAGGSKLGEDLPFQEKDLVTGKKFVNKLWNASKFALMNLGGYDGSKPETLCAIDKWILSKLQKVVQSATESFDKYEYSKAKSESELFFWQILCDNYLEIVKWRLYDESLVGSDVHKSAQYTLATVVETMLKLMAPFTPYITEEIYQLYFSEKSGVISVHNSAWPVVDKSLIGKEMEKAGDAVVEVVAAVRKAKSDAQASLKTPVSKLTVPESMKDSLSLVEKDLMETTKAVLVEYGTEIFVELDLSEQVEKKE